MPLSALRGFNVERYSMKIRQFKNAPKFSKLQTLSMVLQTGTRDMVRDHVAAIMSDGDFASIGWQTAFAKLSDVIADNAPRFAIFAMGGNSKLPFVAFSTLPGVTCPGAGECISFCYSYSAWRYPSAFARMAQNAYLLRFAPDTIADAFADIARARPEGFDFRLYVDGDFASAEDVVFWMDILRTHPHTRAYGYSKSFAILLGYDAGTGGAWPSNYQLNISSGHNASARMVDYVRALPITRGEFIAVSIGRKVKSAEHGTPDINAALRAATFPLKIFPCPGACGSCTGKGHACGMSALKGIPIAIAIH
ncbi:Gene 88 protein [uncultured Caudovirales phage]|uniref:Gene 88 protein n=1 Tax=uncultured Caudovirales phage TaxID=2100421 RepID=A0A6J5KLN9_9CAUD|nr:Gene 88 protein [uncultured Caudovirales phage]